MKTPTVPPNEEARLIALQSYGILDTTPEREYDDQAIIASYICGCPIALISFVDRERQWFKSVVGLNAQETPRDYSFCAHSLMQDDLFEVTDASKDERFSDNPLVTGNPHIRFYAGAPIISPEGYNLGTLCVIDSVPRQLNREQREALHALAKTVVRHLQQRLEAKELKARKAEIEKLYVEKSELIGLVSHDLRNVLAGISGLSQILLEEAQGEITLNHVDRLNFTQEIFCNSESALQMLTELLSAEQLESSSSIDVFSEAFPVTKIIARLRERNLGQARRKDISIDFDIRGGDFTIHTDQNLLTELLDNLLNNAIKYTQKGKRTGLLARKIDATHAHFCVWDEGPGFSEEDRKHLFTRFKRLSARPTAGEPSTGLGMSIVKQLVDRLGGQIAINSTLGKGTEFLIHLPTEREYCEIPKETPPFREID